MAGEYALDAHTLIWFPEGNPRLGPSARAALQGPSQPEREAERHGLGSREHQIEASDSHPVLGRVEELAGGGVGTGQHARQPVVVDAAPQSHRCGGLAQPHPLGLVARRAMVLASGGHGVQVVALAAPSHLGDAQHGGAS